MPTRKDKTNVAPIYREQVFIPASGATLMKQKARPNFNGFPIASGAIDIVSPEFDLLTGIRGIANLPKGFLKTKGLPKGEELYYRQVARENNPLERAKNIGIVDVKSAPKKDFVTRSGLVFNFGKTFDVPFFSKGDLWYGYNPKYDVIVGKDNPLLDWKTITKGGRVTKPTISNPRRTPYYMEEANQAPTELFELYRHYPGIGYRNVTHGFPTIPITGLNTAAEQMKCGGRRKAQLGLDIREGGIAIPIAPNMYYMDGRSHDNGGIAIGPNNKNGLEVEGGEVVKVGKNDVKVFSSVPLLRGVSPAQLVLGGANPNTVFKAQEEFKDRNRINDDGTRYENGGEKIYTPSKSIQRQIQETGRITIGGAPTIGGLRTAKYVKGLATAKGYAKQANKIFTKVDNFVNNSLQGLINKHKITPNQADAYKKFYNEIVGVNGVNIPKTASFFLNNESKEMKAGGIYIKPSKRGTFTAAATKHGMGVQEFASKVLANKEDYSPAMVKKANFARNASRWKKEYEGRTKAPFGLESPIKEGYYPESSEPQTIKWLSDWLNGRRAQLYENAASSPSHSFYYSKPFDEIRGLFKGISGNRLQTNRVFYSLINNAASATHKIGDTVSSIASGQYDKKANEITYPNSNIDMNSSIHERTHAMKSKPQTVKIKSILGDRYNQPWGEPDPNSMTYPLVQYMNQYLSDPEEIYSRMMEYRYNSNLKPSDKVDVNQLNKNRELLKNLNLHYMSDEDLMNLFNNVASNKDNKIKAKYGGSMIYTINGNVRNGLTLRPKATLGTKKEDEEKKKKNPNEARYASRIKKGKAQEVTTQPVVEYNETADKNPDKYRYTRSTGFKADKSPSSTGGGTQPKDGRWIGQYKTTNVGDWIGLGSNLAGSVASYFMTKNAINKMPEPLKPVMAQAAKLKTKYNIESQLTNVREAEQMNRAAVRRNTQSSNTSLAREQRLMNEARGARNTLYGQKENIETQLINQDKLNRQSVMRDNVRAYNEYLNRVTATKMAQNEMRASNINNLISGLTGSVNNILGTIESRRATNNTLRAIAAANPNVDARLIGGFDYYIDPITKKKYNKNQQYVGTING